MNSLMNYGSDDDYEDSGDEKYPETFGVSAAKIYRKPGSGAQEDVNYDNVEMDMSEDSNDEPTEKPRKSDAREQVEERRPSSGYYEKDRSSPKRHNNRDNREDNKERRRDDRDRDSSWRDKGSWKDRASGDGDRNKAAKRDEDRDRGRDRVRDNREDKDEDRRDRYRDREDRDDSRKDKYRDRSEKDGERRERYRDDRRDRREERSSGSSRDERYSSKDRKERELKRSRSRDRKSRSPPGPPMKKSRSRSKERGQKGGVSKRYERANNKMDKLDKMGIEIKTPDCQYVTPADLKTSMTEEKQDAINAQANKDRFFMPGITGRFREQIEKRKMLWQKGKEPEVARPAVGRLMPGITSGAAGGSKATKVYEATTFADDKTSSKFKRLMGIKESGDAGKGATDVLKKQEEMFSSMEQQYEVARTATHTMRGVGLGFGSFQR